MRRCFHAVVSYKVYKATTRKGKQIVSKNYKPVSFETVIGTMDKEEILERYRPRLCINAGLSSMDETAKIEITNVKLLNQLQYD